MGWCRYCTVGETRRTVEATVKCRTKLEDWNTDYLLWSHQTQPDSAECKTRRGVLYHSKMVNKAKRSSFRIPKTAWDHSYKIPDFLLTGDWRSVSPCRTLAGDTNFTVLRNIFLTAPTFLISINGKWLYCWVVPEERGETTSWNIKPLTFPTLHWE